MISLIARGLVPALIAGAAAAVIPAGAGAAPIGAAAKNVSAPSEVVKVHTRKHKHYGRYYERHVDAPFAHVETGRHTVVDAPFTTVYVGRHGRYVRAPFVNLWIPR
jgi:hypothetical protein